MRHRTVTQKMKWVPWVVQGVYLCLFSLILYILLRQSPPSQSLLTYISSFYKVYGYRLVLISGICEATFPLGLYFPGSAAILLGAALSRQGFLFLPFIIFLGTLGLTVGYVINYWVGRSGLYKLFYRLGLKKPITEAKKKLLHQGTFSLFWGYISPNVAVFTSTGSGILQVPFLRFFLISLFSQLWWSTLWGGLAYLFGFSLVTFVLNYLSYLIWGGVGLWVLRKALQRLGF